MAATTQLNRFPTPKYCREREGGWWVREAERGRERENENEKI